MKKSLSILAIAYGVFNQAAWADVTVSPRVSYYFDNSNQRGSGLDRAAQIDPAEIDRQTTFLQSIYGPDSGVEYTVTGTGGQASQLPVPMFGLAVTVGSDDLSFTFTGMYGKGHQTIKTTSTVFQETVLAGFAATDTLTVTGQGRNDAKRYDFEATAQKRLNERFAIIGGFRYERVTGRADVTFNSTASNNASNLGALLTGDTLDFDIVTANGSSRFTATSEVYSARGGISGYIPFSQTGTVFLTGMLHVSHETNGKSTQVATDPVTGAVTRTTSSEPSETTLGPDFAVGAQFGLAENLAFDIRYRAAVYFPVSGPRDFKDPRVNHGVNMGISYRF